MHGGGEIDFQNRYASWQGGVGRLPHDDSEDETDDDIKGGFWSAYASIGVERGSALIQSSGYSGIRADITLAMPAKSCVRPGLRRRSTQDRNRGPPDRKPWGGPHRAASRSRAGHDRDARARHATEPARYWHAPQTQLWATARAQFLHSVSAIPRRGGYYGGGRPTSALAASNGASIRFIRKMATRRDGRDCPDRRKR